MIVDDSYKHGGVLLHMHLSQSKPAVDHEYEGFLFHIIVHGLVVASNVYNQTVLLCFNRQQQCSAVSCNISMFVCWHSNRPCTNRRCLSSVAFLVLGSGLMREISSWHNSLCFRSVCMSWHNSLWFQSVCVRGHLEYLGKPRLEHISDISVLACHGTRVCMFEVYA